MYRTADTSEEDDQEEDQLEMKKQNTFPAQHQLLVIKIIFSVSHNNHLLIKEGHSTQIRRLPPNSMESISRFFC